MGMLAVRIDDAVKARGTEIMRENGYTPSSAVQEFFSYIVQNERMPFERRKKPNGTEVRKRLAALSSLKAPGAHAPSDDDIRTARIEERYGIDVR